MTLEEIIKLSPQVLLITEEVLTKASKQLKIEFDFDLTWEEMGMRDEFDLYTLVYIVEGYLDVSYDDYIVEALFNLYKKPPNFKQFIRSQKLDDLGL